MDTEPKYDAFISYRHLPLDKAVASRLQTLLESYRPPKSLKKTLRGRINRIFRDESELPTNGDLGSGIRDALESSRYLILVCSKLTKGSRWCAEEVRFFKQLHDGRLDRILTVLVEGEPHEVFLPELCEETLKFHAESGESLLRLREVEPLCADVRADSIKGSLRRLSSEYLRIAAPLLGCSFDDLYRRHLKRRTQRQFLIVLMMLTLVSSFSAYNVYMLGSLEKKQNALLTNQSLSLAWYAGKELENGDTQLAMLLSLSALPQNLKAPERPLVSEAETALRNAVFLHEYYFDSSPLIEEHVFKFSVPDLELVKRSSDESRLAVTDFTSTFVFSTETGALIRKYESNSICFNGQLTRAVIFDINPDWDNGLASFQVSDVVTGKSYFGGTYQTRIADNYFTPMFTGRDEVCFYSSVADEKNIEIGKYVDGTGENRQCEFVIHYFPKIAVAFGSDGHILDEKEVEAILTPESERPDELKEQWNNKSSDIIISPRGTYKVECTENRENVLKDVVTARVLMQLPSGADGFCFSGDEKIFGMINSNNIVVLSLDNMQPLYNVQTVARYRPDNMGFSPDGSLFYLNLYDLEGEDEYEQWITRFFDWRNDSEIWQSQGATRGNSLFPRFYTVMKNAVKVVEYNKKGLDTKKPDDSDPHVRKETRFNDDGRIALLDRRVLDLDQEEYSEIRITLHDLGTSQAILEKVLFIANNDDPNKFNYEPAYFYSRSMDRFICYTSAATLDYWGNTAKPVTWSLPLETLPTAVAIDDDGNKVACLYLDGTVEIRSALDGKVDLIIPDNLKEPSDGLFNGFCHLEIQGPTLFVSWGDDRSRLIDIKAGKEIRRFVRGVHAVHHDRYLSSDGLVFLTTADNYEPRLDIVDCLSGRQLLSLNNGATEYDYSERSRILVYQPHNSQMANASTIVIAARVSDEFVNKAVIRPKDSESTFELDPSGTYLTVSALGGTTIYELPAGRVVLDVPVSGLSLRGALEYSHERIIKSFEKNRAKTYSLLSVGDLMAKANQLLTSSDGRKRELDDDERKQFFLKKNIP